MNPVVLIIIFSVCFAFIGLGIFYRYRELQKVSKGIINYDNFVREFIFKIDKPKEEIISILSSENKSDFFSCTLNQDENNITFYEFGDKNEYKYDIQEYDNYCILRLKQTSIVSNIRDVLYKLNPFIVKKLNAKIIPYSKDGFDFWYLCLG